MRYLTVAEQYSVGLGLRMAARLRLSWQHRAACLWTIKTTSDYRQLGGRSRRIVKTQTTLCLPLPYSGGGAAVPRSPTIMEQLRRPQYLQPAKTVGRLLFPIACVVGAAVTTDELGKD